MADVEQVGALNTVQLEQGFSAGNRNEARIAQLGAGGHIVNLEQRGDAYADILQRGSENILAGFDGLGNADVSSAARSLDASRLVLTQMGSGNQAFVHQEAAAVAHIVQDGSANLVLLRQSSGSFP